MTGSTRDRASMILAFAGLAALAYAALRPLATEHPVTPAMSEAAAARAGQPVPDLELVGTDGRVHSPRADSRGRPLVLIFIQDGCPCSESADPYFARLGAAYGEDAAFLGVVDGDLEAARAWSARHDTPYPVVADPERRLIKACGAERSAYVMLAAPGGTIEALWPGYSAAMLAEVGDRLARLAGRPPAALDVEGAPERLVSGCPFP